jgi:hypothetical protein
VGDPEVVDEEVRDRRRLGAEIERRRVRPCLVRPSAQVDDPDGQEPGCGRRGHGENRETESTESRKLGEHILIRPRLAAPVNAPAAPNRFVLLRGEHARKGGECSPVATSEERMARNEALFREFNERIENVAGGFDIRGEGDSLLIEFVCECGSLECLEHIELTRRQYEAVRADPRRFVVVRGHEDPAIARIVELHGNFAVVEKLADAAEVAVEHDPRS